jgi:hypothetical protein
MNNKYLIIFPLLVLVSCNATRKSIQAYSGEKKQAARIAIADFLNTSQLSYPDNVFMLTFMDIKEGILGVDIYGVTTKEWAVKDGDAITTNGFPTNYIEQNDKLFYWEDSTKSVSQEMITMLKKYNWIDTAIRNVYIPMKTIDETKKGEDYYFCKCNLNEYKKVSTSISMGHYEPPKLKCRCNAND